MARTTGRPPGVRPDPPPAPPAHAGTSTNTDLVLLTNNGTNYDGNIVPAVGDHPPRRKCDHCGRFNEGTTCDGCGAPVDWSERRATPRPPFPQNRTVR